MFRTGQMFGAGYIEQVLTGQSSERSLMNGHEALSVWNIVAGDEMALLKPVHRALLLRDALRTNHHGGLEFGPAARALIKAKRGCRWSCRPSARRRAAAPRPLPPIRRQSLVRGAARQAPRAGAGSGSAALRHLPRLGATRHGGAASDRRAALSLLSGIGARKLDAYGEAFLAVIREAG